MHFRALCTAIFFLFAFSLSGKKLLPTAGANTAVDLCVQASQTTDLSCGSHAKTVEELADEDARILGACTQLCASAVADCNAWRDEVDAFQGDCQKFAAQRCAGKY